jgi:hypothetical protein
MKAVLQLFDQIMALKGFRQVTVATSTTRSVGRLRQRVMTGDSIDLGRRPSSFGDIVHTLH